MAIFQEIFPVRRERVGMHTGLTLVPFPSDTGEEEEKARNSASSSKEFGSFPSPSPVGRRSKR